MIAQVLRFCCPFAKYVWGGKCVTERSVKKVPVSTVTCERILEESQMTGSFVDKNKMQKHLFTLDKTWFMLSIKTTNIGVVKIPMKFMCMTLKFGVWCAVNAHKSIKTVGFERKNCS
jgi:hypothetical protein